VDQVTQAMMNKILHHPIALLKEMSNNPTGEDIVELIRRIFNIKPQ
jgi:glutamyl-tRNA reductase